MVEFNTKISNEVITCLSEINAFFTAKLGKINTELNNKLTAEIEIFKARNAGYVTEVQKILGRLNNIKEACHNDFGSIRSLVKSITSKFMSINVVIKDLQNKINQHYAIVQRSNFDQLSVSNESEVNSTNESETNSQGSSSNLSSSSSSGSSNLSGILDITSDIKICFKQHFDRLMKARNYTFDEMCFSVVIDIHSLEGNIKTSIVKNFYNGVSGSKVSTINQINTWVASFNNNAE